MLYRKLEVSERKYRELVENAHEGIWIIDETGGIKFANRRMREITGHDTLENRKIYNLLDKDNQARLREVMAQNRMDKVAQQELDIMCKNRELASVIMSSVPLFEDGHLSGLLPCSVISRPYGKRKSDFARSLKKRPSACLLGIWTAAS